MINTNIEPLNINEQNSTPYHNGFGSGYDQLPYGDVRQATKELWKALDINNKVSFSLYKLGKNRIYADQAERVEWTFNKYGVENNIWGKSKYNIKEP